MLISLVVAIFWSIVHEVTVHMWEREFVLLKRQKEQYTYLPWHHYIINNNLLIS